MLYASSPFAEVVGRVIRNTRIQDSSFLVDMREWIPEAMGYMKTKEQYQTRWALLDVEFFKARLPCGIKGLYAVIDMNGNRMSWYAGQDVAGMPVPVTGPSRPTTDQDTAFLTNIVSRETFEESITYETILTALSSAAAGNHRYYIEMDYINTSFCDGRVLVVYARLPLDADGLPLIPDNEDYKEALYWYIRAKMIGAGYNDRVMSMTDCEARMEKYAARAIGSIRYRSVDQAQHAFETLTQLVMPTDMWENFFGDVTNHNLSQL